MENADLSHKKDYAIAKTEPGQKAGNGKIDLKI